MQHTPTSWVHRPFEIADIRDPEGLLLAAQRLGHGDGAVPAYATAVESQIAQYAAPQTDTHRLQFSDRFDCGFDCGGSRPVAVGALGPAQILGLCGGLQWEIWI